MSDVKHRNSLGGGYDVTAIPGNREVNLAHGWASDEWCDEWCDEW
jgi:hypothetical protein